MRIDTVHVIGSRGSGGAERFFLRLVHGLVQAGQPTLAVVRPGSAVAVELGPGVEQRTVPMRAVWDLASRWRIGALLKRRQPQLVQTYMGRATRLTRLSPGTPVVHVARLGGFYKLDGYRHAHAWIGNTRAICDYLRANGFPAERVFHIGNFVEPPVPVPREQVEALRAAHDIPSDALIALGVGRLVEKKGFQDLLAAFGELPAAIGQRPVHLLIVGDGPLGTGLRAAAHSAGLAGRVHWTGWQRDPGPYYQMADIFACPSRHEPLGNVILEAWSHGLPVISTATHGARELVTPADGLLVPCAEPSALARAMEELLRDAAARRELGQAGAGKVRQAFTPQAVIAAYLALYRRLLESPPVDRAS